MRSSSSSSRSDIIVVFEFIYKKWRKHTHVYVKGR